jgi:Cd2+/Zn2+-exporting ATPase
MSEAELTEKLKFKVIGMNCAACATKIEAAVRRVSGVGAVEVGINSGTLSVELSHRARRPDIEKAVRGLGYGITTAPGGGSDRTEHKPHAAPIERAWWTTSKGRSVILTGVLIVAGYLESRQRLPYDAWLLFFAACIVGGIPVLRRALQAVRRG